ncbi:MAG: hypothetical protein U9R08_03455 [Nanoarchaeota archaeon]|nr:hypothetical protein [Nanoarchaeota archaeon]
MGYDFEKENGFHALQINQIEFGKYVDDNKNFAQALLNEKKRAKLVYEMINFLGLEHTNENKMKVMMILGHYEILNMFKEYTD